jgi:hypothetical protein
MRKPSRPLTRPLPRGSGGEESGLVVFLGPSLPADEARALAPCTVLPPARAGDLFALLPRRPRAIALIDGLFEGAPSVWHHELLAALGAGVAVFGGASMGALRAAELEPFGMAGVGTIFGWYRDGAIVGDDEVALYHGPARRSFRPYTVPLVDVRWATVQGARRDLFHPPAARAVLDAAQALHFGDRTWDRILAEARLSARERQLLLPFFRSVPSLKAQDARATIRAAAKSLLARRPGGTPTTALPPLPSHARRRRLAVARSVAADGSDVAGSEVLAALRRRPDAAALTADGLRRSLLAAFARQLGLSPSAAQAARAERAWLDARRAKDRSSALKAAGLDEGAARELFEALALEALVLERSTRVVPDGPAADEGLALGARLSGAWGDEARRLARRGR